MRRSTADTGDSRLGEGIQHSIHQPGYIASPIYGPLGLCYNKVPLNQESQYVITDLQNIIMVF